MYFVNIHLFRSYIKRFEDKQKVIQVTINAFVHAGILYFYHNIPKIKNLIMITSRPGFLLCELGL